MQRSAKFLLWLSVNDLVRSCSSKVLVWLVETKCFLSVDGEVARVNIVALHDHLEDFGLMNSTLLHEVDDLILDCDGVINVVVKLHLKLVLKLSVFLEEVFVVDGISKVFIIFSKEIHLAVVGPRVESVSHRVLRPNSHVLAATKKEKSMDLLVETFPVKNVGHPG